jgi:hypothetical protein
VIEPWKAIVAQAKAATVEDTGADPKPSPADKDAALRKARDQVQVASWLVLLDLAEFLQTQIPDLWKAVLSETRPTATTALGEAYDILDKAALGPNLSTAVKGTSTYSVPASLLKALKEYGQPPDGIKESLKEQLETVVEPYDTSVTAKPAKWPGFLFPLADPDPTLFTAVPLASDLNIVPPLTDEEVQDLELSTTKKPPTADPLDEFAVALARALPADAAGPEPAIPTAALTPADSLNAVFRIRCVYERPNCGPLHEDVVSDPTELFDLASFFDPDAPARPIRIGLPLDTTPAGLRKFDKNTAFVMSDILCGQLARFKNITFGDLILSVLPWPLHKDLPVADSGPCEGGGTICSLSIPIITLCALIILIIFVTLLNIVFGWLPFFKICFPIRNLTGKKT